MVKIDELISWQQIHLSGTGEVAALESKLKQYYGMQYALCVTNATTGLWAIALALGLQNQQFVTTPYTYGATLASWLFLGNQPIFADIEPDTLSLSCEAVRQVITPKTKALLAVDLFGIPSDTVALRQLASEYGLWYVADAAQSLGATRGGLPASLLADALVVSFTTGKTVFAGEGGAILTNHADLYEKLIWYTQHPIRQHLELGLYLDNEFAINGRIHPLAAVLANATFEESLQNLQVHQQECFQVIELLNSLGLTEDIDFANQGINPSFFRLTATLKDSTQISTLLKILQSHGFRGSLESPPVRLIYRQPSFLAQYQHKCQQHFCCPQAEYQSVNRFCIASNEKLNYR
ncbi:DegT/DnrJ/EryC1/StrS aminotransferase [Crinalium epipsammum PCC 9333]|uniref:DegT/DnrJ/EryC1/StrS aminotransferase n=1 Tax=Crinalium epipsammum PCC 9333 TaxID=1173022 RepID=K9VTY6_9CYAN|nr:DegT/DnrJ/EryC1/StrS family aminotransferase [Crinalium epipsammum]AFZ11533.1 DegT/DnrJ/EryC1/StrS aminotransferase [Crinalium epipsammum PCC 9333]